MKKNLKAITTTAIMIALYVVLSVAVGIPIINNIKLDLGYVVLGVCSSLLLGWQNMAIAGFGCMFKALIANGQFPLGWFPSNVLLGFVITKTQKVAKMWLRVLLSVLAVFVCICLIKTLIEVWLFELPFWAKIESNAVAATIDSVALVIGMEISRRVDFSKIIK